VVKLVKQHVKDAITLAIGDGANDVGMIQVEDLFLIFFYLASVIASIVTEMKINLVPFFQPSIRMAYFPRFE